MHYKSTLHMHTAGFCARKTCDKMHVAWVDQSTTLHHICSAKTKAYIRGTASAV